MYEQQFIGYFEGEERVLATGERDNASEVSCRGTTFIPHPEAEVQR